jgi:hypothetical protein
MKIAQPSAASSASPLSGQHDQVERAGAFDLEPGGAPAARRVRRFERLDHDPFVPRGQRLLEKTGRQHRAGTNQARDDGASIERLGERGRPALQRLVEERRPVNEEAVEEKRRERQVRAQPVDIETSAEAPHRDLKRMRRARRLKRDHLAVDDEFAARRRARDRNHFRNRVGDFLQGPREDVDVVAGLVDLDARAIELLFHQRIAGVAERLLQIRRRFSQHRMHGPQQLHREPCERRLTIDDDCARNRREVARHHHRAPQRGRTYTCRLRDRIDHDALERALPQLTVQQSHEKILFGPRGARKKIRQQSRSSPGRTAAAGRCDLAQRTIDGAERD